MTSALLGTAIRRNGRRSAQRVSELSFHVAAPESFRLSPDHWAVWRTILRRDGTAHTTAFPLLRALRRERKEQELAELADAAFLRSPRRPPVVISDESIRVVDLFSGCGAMSLGAWEACRAIGRRFEPLLAVDFDQFALRVYETNFPAARVECSDVMKLLDSPLNRPPSKRERELVEWLGPVDLLIGGPPCQGHSDLNNRTRRADPKNRLYDRMARFAEIVKPTHIIVENVPAVRHDLGQVLPKTMATLQGLGYNLDHDIVELSALGAPQSRRRHVLLASRERQPHVKSYIDKYRRETRTVRWAISDLRRRRSRRSFDTPGKATAKSQKRIDWLFDHDEHDLPDRLRPDCHRLRDHSYRSVYGRMFWDEPAQTITSGFGCMGQGRYVHALEPRTITPHEAARLQFIPDFFTFPDDLPRTALSDMIGNAVPVKLTYVLALELLR